MATAKKATKKAGAAKATKATKTAGAAKATKAAGSAKTTKAAGSAKTTKATKAAGTTAGAGGSEIFGALKKILLRYARDLVVVHDKDDYYYLDTRTMAPNRKPLFFGATRAGKAYTSFYLMPVYTNPELLDGLSPELKKRRQGKSCFNFKKVEPALFEELGELTARGFDLWKASGQI